MGDGVQALLLYALALGGLTPRSISTARLAGAVLLIAGVVLITD
jgi:hypothetical protein